MVVFYSTKKAVQPNTGNDGWVMFIGPQVVFTCSLVLGDYKQVLCHTHNLNEKADCRVIETFDIQLYKLTKVSKVKITKFTLDNSCFRYLR